MTLKNCYSTPGNKLVMRYSDEQEIDTVFFDWCLDTKQVRNRNNMPARLNPCNVFDENQVRVCVCVMYQKLSYMHVSGLAKKNERSNSYDYFFFMIGQIFDLIGIDDTLRSAADKSLCVTCRSNQCLREGGTLKYKPCSRRDLSGNKKYRTGQAFIYCFLRSSCTVDQQINRLDCMVEERCGSK